MKRSSIAIAAIGTGALAVTAMVTARSARRAERENPPTGSFVSVDGVRMHYIDEGTGPPVVLLHGNGVTSEDWRASGVLDLLARHHRVVAFDRPGFGYSERPRGTAWTPGAQASLIAKALTELRVRDAVIAGHSWGTLVALALAFDHPETVSRLALVSGYYFPTVRFDVPGGSAPAMPVIGDILRYTVSPVVGRLTSPLLIRQLFAPAPVAPHFAEFPLSMSLRPSQLRASAEDTALMVPSAHAFAEKYRSLAVPVAVVAGSGDKIVSPHAQSERLAQTIAGASLQTIEGAGHMVHYAAPQTVADSIVGLPASEAAAAAAR